MSRKRQPQHVPQTPFRRVLLVAEQLYVECETVLDSLQPTTRDMDRALTLLDLAERIRTAARRAAGRAEA